MRQRDGLGNFEDMIRSDNEGCEKRKKADRSEHACESASLVLPGWRRYSVTVGMGSKLAAFVLRLPLPAIGRQQKRSSRSQKIQNAC